MEKSKHKQFQLTPLDEYIVRSVKEKRLIYDRDAPYYYSSEKRKSVFHEISENVKCLYEVKKTGAEICERWLKLREKYTKTDLKKKRGKRLTEADKEILQMLKFLEHYTSHKGTYSDDEYDLDEIKYPNINVNDPDFDKSSPEVEEILKSIEKSTRAYSNEKENFDLSACDIPKESNSIVIISDEDSTSAGFESNYVSDINQNENEFVFITDYADESTATSFSGEQMELSSTLCKPHTYIPIKIKQENNRENKMKNENQPCKQVKTTGPQEIINNNNYHTKQAPKKKSSTAKDSDLKDALRTFNDNLNNQALDVQISARANIVCDNLGTISKDKMGIAFIKIMNIFKSYLPKE